MYLGNWAQDMTDEERNNLMHAMGRGNLATQPAMAMNASASDTKSLPAIAPVQTQAIAPVAPMPNRPIAPIEPPRDYFPSGGGNFHGLPIGNLMRQMQGQVRGIPNAPPGSMFGPSPRAMEALDAQEPPPPVVTPVAPLPVATPINRGESFLTNPLPAAPIQALTPAALTPANEAAIAADPVLSRLRAFQTRPSPALSAAAAIGDGASGSAMSGIEAAIAAAPSAMSPAISPVSGARPAIAPVNSPSFTPLPFNVPDGTPISQPQVDDLNRRYAADYATRRQMSFNENRGRMTPSDFEESLTAGFDPRTVNGADLARYLRSAGPGGQALIDSLAGVSRTGNANRATDQNQMQTEAQFAPATATSPGGTALRTVANAEAQTAIQRDNAAFARSRDRTRDQIILNDRTQGVPIERTNRDLVQLGYQGIGSTRNPDGTITNPPVTAQAPEVINGIRTDLLDAMASATRTNTGGEVLGSGINRTFKNGSDIPKAITTFIGALPPETLNTRDGFNAARQAIVNQYGAPAFNNWLNSGLSASSMLENAEQTAMRARYHAAASRHNPGHVIPRTGFRRLTDAIGITGGP